MRAGLAARAEEYRWSTARRNRGTAATEPGILDGGFGSGRVVARRGWKCMPVENMKVGCTYYGAAHRRGGPSGRRRLLRRWKNISKAMAAMGFRAGGPFGGNLRNFTEGDGAVCWIGREIEPVDSVCPLRPFGPSFGPVPSAPVPFGPRDGGTLAVPRQRNLDRPNFRKLDERDRHRGTYNARTDSQHHGRRGFQYPE